MKFQVFQDAQHVFSKLTAVFYFLDRAFSIMKTKINPNNAQINSG